MDAVFEYIEEDTDDLSIDLYKELYTLRENDLEAYGRKVEQLTLDICDVDRFVKENECEEVTNPMFFMKGGIPTDDGLLSNKIFGLTKDERAGIFAYIDLKGTFIDPSCYKQLCKIDKNIKACVHQTDKFIINSHGELVPDEKGKNGIKFLKDNFSKIKFRKTDSIQRDLRIKYIEKNKDKMFITKYLVIPAYYRDVDTSSKGKSNVGAINKLYAKLISNAAALTSTQDMGFDMTGAITGTIQETLVTIYNWFVGNNDDSIQEPGTGISGKFGILRMANMSKTTDYASRLVISSTNLKVETTDNAMVNLEQSALPLASAIANYKPYICFHVKHFFENELQNGTKYPCMNSEGKVIYLTPKDPQIEFSDEVIETQMKRFLHGYSNRLIPVEIHVEENNKTYHMVYKGRPNKDNIIAPSDEFFHRDLTWCDVFYMAAVEATKDKMITITRFPIESQYSQVPTGVVINSTTETIPVYVDNTYYPYYPKIKQSDIGKDTSNMFVDVLIMSNLLLDGLGADQPSVA